MKDCRYRNGCQISLVKQEKCFSGCLKVGLVALKVPYVERSEARSIRNQPKIEELEYRSLKIAIQEKRIKCGLRKSRECL